MNLSNQIKGFFAVVIAVNNLDEGIKNYQKIGFELIDRRYREDLGLEVAQLKVGESSVIELLAPLSLEKPVAKAVRKFLDKNGDGVYTIAVETHDIESVHQYAKGNGVSIVAAPHPLPIFPATKLMWISPKSTNGVFLEFIQGSSLFLEHNQDAKK